MRICNYCRCEFEGSKCPNCGGSGKEKNNNSLKNNSNIFDTLSSSNVVFENNGIDYSKAIGKAQSIARTIRYAIKTWIVCIILGLILSYFMKEGKIAFLEENHDIFTYVKNILFYFGWAVGILLSKIRRYI